jgi:putative hydrolase of the HAD superfamily
MIKAVLFDLYETLITESHLAPTRASSLAHALGLERQAYRAEWQARRPRIVVGELSFADALTEVSRMLVGSVDAAVVQQICEQRAREKAAAFAHPDHQVMTLITGLGRRGVGLGVVSNGFREDVLPWSDCSLAPLFQCTAFSCEEGVAKPDPEIYLRAMHRLRGQPETTVYVGDGGDNELTGAEKAGLRAFRAAWFVRSSSQGSSWPALTTCGDVLKLVTTGELPIGADGG